MYGRHLLRCIVDREVQHFFHNPALRCSLCEGSVVAAASVARVRPHRDTVDICLDAGLYMPQDGVSGGRQG